MKVTFLGHQGWLIENDKGRRFLLDPILEDIGNGDDKLPVWPQRRLDFSKFEPIEAVIITHEHADHFSLETLMALPRRCRVYISELSSIAMGLAITEMGFHVERFCALKTYSIVGIRVTPLPGLYNLLEPDTFAFLMRDDSGASFLTAVDTVPHPDLFAWLANNCPQRTLDNLTNNFIEARRGLVKDPSAYTKSRAIVAGTMMEFVQQFKPRRAIISGQGWSFKGAKAQFNQSFFSVDNAWLTQTARELAPHVDWINGIPGMRFELRGQEVIADINTDITMLPSVDRTFDPNAIARSEPYEPWTGTRELSSERLGKVQQFIREEYGAILGSYAPKLMERLYYLKFTDDDTCVSTLAVVLRNGDTKSIYEFDYGHLLFREVAATTKQAAVGLELWASDLDHLLAAKEESFMVYESSIRPWSLVPAMLDEAELIECFMWFTPRFRPKETLQFYRSQIAALRNQQGVATLRQAR